MAVGTPLGEPELNSSRLDNLSSEPQLAALNILVPTDPLFSEGGVKENLKIWGKNWKGSRQITRIQNTDQFQSARGYSYPIQQTKGKTALKHSRKHETEHGDFSERGPRTRKKQRTVRKTANRSQGRSSTKVDRDRKENTRIHKHRSYQGTRKFQKRIRRLKITISGN